MPNDNRRYGNPEFDPAEAAKVRVKQLRREWQGIARFTRNGSGCQYIPSLVQVEIGADYRYLRIMQKNNRWGDWFAYSYADREISLAVEEREDFFEYGEGAEGLRILDSIRRTWGDRVAICSQRRLVAEGERRPERPVYNQSIAHVQFNQDYSAFRVLCPSDEWGRWTPVGKFHTKIKNRLARFGALTGEMSVVDAALIAKKYDQTLDVGKQLIESANGHYRFFHGKWVECWLEGDIHCVLTFTSGARQRRRDWKEKNLKRLFERGLNAWTVRIDREEEKFKLEYAGCPTITPIVSKWFLYEEFAKVLKFFEDRSYKEQWRRTEQRIIYESQPEESGVVTPMGVLKVEREVGSKGTTLSGEYSPDGAVPTNPLEGKTHKIGGDIL